MGRTISHCSKKRSLNRSGELAWVMVGIAFSGFQNETNTFATSRADCAAFGSDDRYLGLLAGRRRGQFKFHEIMRLRDQVL